MSTVSGGAVLVKVRSLGFAGACLSGPARERPELVFLEMAGVCSCQPLQDAFTWLSLASSPPPMAKAGSSG